LPVHLGDEVQPVLGGGELPEGSEVGGLQLQDARLEERVARAPYRKGDGLAEGELRLVQPVGHAEGVGEVAPGARPEVRDALRAVGFQAETARHVDRGLGEAAHLLRIFEAEDPTPGEERLVDAEPGRALAAVSRELPGSPAEEPQGPVEAGALSQGKVVGTAGILLQPVEERLVGGGIGKRMCGPERLAAEQAKDRPPYVFRCRILSKHRRKIFQVAVLEHSFSFLRTLLSSHKWRRKLPPLPGAGRKAGRGGSGR